MPGTGHNMSTEFISTLPFRAQQAARMLLALHPLETQVRLRLEGPDRALIKEFGDLDKDTWRRTFNAVLLTKISTLELYQPFSQQEYDRILDVISLALGLGGKHPPLPVLIERTTLRYPRFHQWLRTFQKLQRTARLQSSPGKAGN